MSACPACDHTHFVAECRCGCHWPLDTTPTTRRETEPETDQPEEGER